MSWSKDRENGMPSFVSDEDKPFVKLVSTEDAQAIENRRIGLKTPGWSYHKQMTRVGGTTRNITETLVAFSGAGTKLGPSGSGDIRIITRATLTPSRPNLGQEVTVIQGTYTGADTVAGVLTFNGVDVTSQIVSGKWTPLTVGTGSYVETASNEAGDSVVTNIALTVVNDGEEPVENPDIDYTVPVGSRVLLNGHSLIDAILSGSGDQRPTLTKTHPDGPALYRKWTIPGSPMSYRWERRFGLPGGQLDPEVGPFEPDNPWGPILPGRDMNHFQATVITEGGPFAQLPDPDKSDQQFFYSDDVFVDWMNLADTNDVKSFFWTIWPGITGPEWSTHRPGDDTTLPVFKSYLKAYNETAEAWCTERGVKIIPGHKLWWDLYDRAEAGTIPGITQFSDFFVDEIHVGHLGSIFNAVTVYRYLHGVLPSDASIQSMLDEGTYQITVAYVKEVVNGVVNTYVQGPGLQIDQNFEPGSDVFFNFNVPSASQGATHNAGVSTIGGMRLNGTNWLYKELPSDYECFYAVLDIEWGENTLAQTGVQMIAGLVRKELGFSDETAGVHFFGWTEVIAGGTTLNTDGQSTTCRLMADKPWGTSTRMKIELIIHPNRVNMKNVTPGTWSDSTRYEVEGYSQNYNRFVVGGSFRNDIFVPIATNFVIHKGFVLTKIPTTRERFTYQNWILK